MTDFDWHSLLQPQWYVAHGGVWIILLIVFAETGLFMGFFLPGDSLLFVSGIMWRDIQQGFFNVPFVLIMVLISIFAILGNQVGYWFGNKIGPAMYTWKDRWYFKQKYLQQARIFYEEHGASAIFLARFIPFIRTFAPIVAGIVRMDMKKFSAISIISAFAWVFSMMLAGRYLHQFLLSQFQYDLTDDLELIVVGIIFVSVLPIVYKILQNKLKEMRAERKAREGQE
ncbi:MAG: VTT domain-containing protein [Saprospiraceae bacterium]|nr:VTT domain-containing protein [Candidatus Opimibacter iunctus]